MYSASIVNRERTDLGTDSGPAPIWEDRIGPGLVKVLTPIWR